MVLPLGSNAANETHRGAVMPQHLPPALPNLWQPQRTTETAPRPDFASAVSQIARQLLADPDTAGAVYDRFLQQVEPPLLATVMSKCGQRCTRGPRARAASDDAEEEANAI